MIQIHPQYIVDASAQRRAVVLSMEEWERLLEELEELADVRLFDEAKRTPEEEIPFELAMREIEEGAVR